MPKRSESTERGIARREEILEAATELFAHKGYRGTGILEIADHVGIGHSGILYHFGTKENLLRAVIERRNVLHDELMAEFLESGLRVLHDQVRD